MIAVQMGEKKIQFFHRGIQLLQRLTQGLLALGHVEAVVHKQVTIMASDQIRVKLFQGVARQRYFNTE